MANTRTITIKCKSRQALTNLANKLNMGLPQVARTVVKDSALQLERDVKINSPVRTGRLRDSFHTKVETGTGYAIGKSSSNVYYGYWVSVGSSRRPPNPFIHITMDSNREDIKVYAMEKLKELIRS